MRKLITITCLLALIIFAAKADNFYLYVSDSGHKFYYTEYTEYNRETTWDEAYFLNAQGFKIIVETKSKNYDRLAMKAKARAILNDSLIALYERNKEYMWEHFPEYKYTQEEFYSIVKKFIVTMSYEDFGNIPCCVESEFDLRRILSSKKMREKLEQYPYIMGYLYKEVKFREGKKCKLQKLDVEYILFQNMPGQMFDVKNQQMIPAKK